MDLMYSAEENTEFLLVARQTSDLLLVDYFSRLRQLSY